MSASSRADVLNDVVTAVFRQGATIVGSDEVPPSQRYYVLGSRGVPRWLVPQDPQLGAVALARWRPQRLGSRCAWWLLRRFQRAELLGRLPGVRRIGVHPCAGEHWRRLGWNEPSLPTVAVYIGTPGPTRKAVAFLVDPNAARVGLLAKAPLGEAARAKIAWEYRALTELAADNGGAAPAPIAYDEASGCSTQTVLAGRPMGTGGVGRVTTYLRRLVVPGCTSVREKASQLREAAANSARTPSGRNLLRHLEQLTDSSELPVVRVHGDFAPWNLLEAVKRGLSAVDWEETDPRGLPLHDFFYFHYQQQYLYSRPISTVQIPSGLQWGIPGSAADQISRYVLISMALNLDAEGRDVSPIMRRLEATS